MCELLVGLPAVTVLGIDDVEDGPIRVHLERSESRTGCPACGVVAESKVTSRQVVSLREAALTLLQSFTTVDRVA